MTDRDQLWAERKAVSGWRDMIADLLAGPYAGRGGIAALAAALGVALVTLRKWRQGTRSPSWGYLQALARLWWLECEPHRDDYTE